MLEFNDAVVTKAMILDQAYDMCCQLMGDSAAKSYCDEDWALTVLMNAGIWEGPDILQYVEEVFEGYANNLLART
jgi:hypothetical protein